jgi:hypothetical protein
MTDEEKLELITEMLLLHSVEPGKYDMTLLVQAAVNLAYQHSLPRGTYKVTEVQV